jgi:hypothetical protein
MGANVDPRSDCFEISIFSIACFHYDSFPTVIPSISHQANSSYAYPTPVALAFAMGAIALGRSLVKFRPWSGMSFLLMAFTSFRSPVFVGDAAPSELTEGRTIVYLDTGTLVSQPIDELFNYSYQFFLWHIHLSPCNSCCSLCLQETMKMRACRGCDARVLVPEFESRMVRIL